MSTPLPSSTTLLIDGDILAFVSAAAAQRAIGNPQVDDSGCIYAFASLPEGIAIMENMLGSLKAKLNATGACIALSSSSNWRKEVLPSYKSNRDELSKPVLLGHLKQHLRDAHGAESVEGLEADDLVGIWATAFDDGFMDQRICVSRDKDFQGIPGFHHTLGDLRSDGTPRVREVTEWQAKRFHLVQCLSGDRIDGYGGCPGLGMARAAAIIDDPKRLVPRAGTITVGKNKGKSVTRWFAEPTNDYWACIVSNYLKAGLTEHDALLTARVAKILLAEDYDFKKGVVRLWTPERIND